MTTPYDEVPAVFVASVCIHGHTRFLDCGPDSITPVSDCSIPCNGRVHGHVHGCAAYTAVYSPCTPPSVYTACTRPVHGRVHGRVPGPYTAIHMYTVRVHSRVHCTRLCTWAVYTCTRPCTGLVHAGDPVHGLHTDVQAVYAVVFTGSKPVFTAHTRPCNGSVRAVYTCTLSAYTSVYTAVYWPCTWAVYIHGRVNGPCTYTAVYMAVQTCTWPCSRSVHGVVTAVYMACKRPGTRLVHCVCTACIRPCTRIHGPYTKARLCNFLTNSCDYVRKQSKAPHCLSMELH